MPERPRNDSGPQRDRHASVDTRHRRSDGRRGTPGILAKFPSMAAARAAIVALEAAGIDGSALSLVGPRADSARHNQGRDVPDRRILSFLGARLGLGITAGMVGGAIVGLVVGLIAAAAWDLSIVVVAILAGAGLLLGGVLGAMTSVEHSAGYSESWPLTFQDVPGGAVWLAVYDHSKAARDAVARVAPLEVRRPTDLDHLARLLRGVE